MSNLRTCSCERRSRGQRREENVADGLSPPEAVTLLSCKDQSSTTIKGAKATRAAASCRDCSVDELPLAPSLDEFMNSTSRPRPEWFVETTSLLHSLTRYHELRCLNTDVSSESLELSVNSMMGELASDFQREERLDSNNENDSEREKVNVETPVLLRGRLFNRCHGKRPCLRASENFQLASFGRDYDSALHIAIRHDATEAARVLIAHGAEVDGENVKGVTPLTLAAQRGNVEIVKALLERGANPGAITYTGTTPLMQASHFGHENVVQQLLLNGGSGLIEVGNVNHTTVLMRAAQEGHLGVVRLLLEAGGQVNRRNRAQMTALMLAAQRGHADICGLLIDHGAELDVLTNLSSTALMLACKRGHVCVVRVLVSAGCELWIKDSRGRTARDVALKQHHAHQAEMMYLLQSSVQTTLMQQRSRCRRNFDLMRIWTLIQRRQVSVRFVGRDGCSYETRDIDNLFNGCHCSFWPASQSDDALLRTMLLPAPLLESVAQFLAFPRLWAQRMTMLSKRAVINPDMCVADSLDFVDEVLEAGGFVTACVVAEVAPPDGFASWQDIIATGPDCIKNTDSVSSVPVLVERRRLASFLQTLARNPRLAVVLSANPYHVPLPVIEQLCTCSDVASITRRLGLQSVHYETQVAMEVLMLVSRLCSWYWQEHE